MIDRLYIVIGCVVALAASHTWAYYKGKDGERDRIISAQLKKQVVVQARQHTETVKEIIKYVHIKEQHAQDLAKLQSRWIAACHRGMLSDGVPVQPGSAAARVPEDGAGFVEGAAAGTPNPADRWCEQTAAALGAGVANTDKLGLALGWLRAHGAAPD